MDVQQGADGRKRFVLGPVELWIIGLVGGLVVTGSATIVMAYATRIDTLNTNTTAMNTRLEVMTEQLATLNKLVAGVPDLQARVGKLEVIAENNRERIRALEAQR